ncbi:MAG: MMPL family transporter [Planctomycetaceae bacterium]|nr:MMPL family transporter [Planctomycetaceae bacterium]
MLSRFYNAHSRTILWLLVATFPLVYWLAHAEKSNNDIETWLPQNTAVRQNYEKFKQDFGVEEVVVLGVDPNAVGDELVESVAARLDAVQGVRECITPQRLMTRMRALGVPEQEARERITGQLIGEGGQLSGVVIGLDEYGAKHRGETVAAIRQVLEYCLLERPEIALTGSPVLVTELDRLGSPEASHTFFAITLVICLGLLKYSIGDWKLSLSLLGVTIWSIYLTKAIVLACGGEMNFIMGALSVMVMIFTLTIAVHYLDYYTEARDHGVPDPLAFALKESFKPGVLSTITTLLGLLSLNVSHILPVQQFGYAAALGAVVAMVVGFGVTPAFAVVWPDRTVSAERTWFDFAKWGQWVSRRRTPLLAGAATLTIIFGIGLTRLAPHIDPVDFLQRSNPVAIDLRRVNDQLTSIGSVEVVVDTGMAERPFVERMLEVRRIQEKIDAHPAVRHSFSVAKLFPTQLPDSPLAAAQMFSTALGQGSGSGYLAQNQRLWRVTVRASRDWKSNEVCNALRELLDGENVMLTGVSPLIADAQNEIFSSYWQSLAMALGTITLVMIVSLRSLTAGLIAMTPNILPIWFVFGFVGYMGMPVDIGMMMTGSIAIGISVDCTFHYLVKYQEEFKKGMTSVDASCAALAHTGKPLMESTVISSMGMLALCLSRFTPTSRFGWLMASLMLVSVIGELILLPALLSLRSNGRVRTAAPLKPVVAMHPDAETPAGRVEPKHPGIVPAPHMSAAKKPVSRARRVI